MNITLFRPIPNLDMVVYFYVNGTIWDKNERELEKLISNFNKKYIYKENKIFIPSISSERSIIPLPFFMTYVAFCCCAILRFDILRFIYVKILPTIRTEHEF